MLSGVSDLDDVEAVHAADIEGALLSAARVGAVVRAVSEACREGELQSLHGLSPRAVVFVCEPGAADRAARFVAAQYAARIDVPLVCVSVLPNWIGPLDVVVVSGGDPEYPPLADALGRAGRRHAEVVVNAPMAGPIAAAVDSSTINLSPRVDMPRRFGFCGHVAAMAATLMELERVRFSGPRLDLAALADRLDTEAHRNHPVNETFHNSAKSLAMSLAGRPILWCGADLASTVLAEQAAAVCALASGIVGCAVPVSEAVEAITGLIARGGAAPPEASIFHDPEFDGPLQVAPRVVVMSSSEREWVVRHAVSSLSDVLVVTAPQDEAVDQSMRSIVAQNDSIKTDDSAAELVVLAARVQMAAVYLQLLGAA